MNQWWPACRTAQVHGCSFSISLANETPFQLQTMQVIMWAAIRVILVWVHHLDAAEFLPAYRLHLEWSIIPHIRHTIAFSKRIPCLTLLTAQMRVIMPLLEDRFKISLVIISVYFWLSRVWQVALLWLESRVGGKTNWKKILTPTNNSENTYTSITRKIKTH